MKGILKGKKIIVVIIVIVIICLFFTGVILFDLVNETVGESSRHWFFEESIQTGQTVVLKNAYIISNENNELKFLYDYKTYEVEGTLAQECSGIADIHINGEKISKIRVKSTGIEGILQAYTENEIVIKEYGTEIKSNDIPIYHLKDGQVMQKEWTQMIIGVSNIECIIENGTVVAIVLKEDVVPTDIRVVIKNGRDIYHSQVYIKKLTDNSITNINSYMSELGLTYLCLEDNQGFIVCDSKGNAVDEVFEGKLHFHLEPEGIVMVNELSMESYLKYVLPSEMPRNFGEEALKAQAVCARTYAYTHINNQSYAKYGANIDDSTDFQAFHNTNRTQETDAAVEATSGEVVTCNGELISCYYYSTSPGITNNMSAWESNDEEYITCAGGEFFSDLDLTKDTDFSKYMTQQVMSYDAISNFYRWKAILDVSVTRDKEKGALKTIEILQRNEAGYVTSVELSYDNTKMILKNENEIRKILGEYVQEIILQSEQIRTDLTLLPSACFEVLVNADGQIVLRGGGFGHGIGMSQYGARGMAEKGYTYKEIIDYYYKNVVVKKL